MSLLLLLRSPVSIAAPTAAEVAAALAGVGQSVRMRFRFYRTDRDGNRVDDITTSIETCSIENNIERDVKRTATFSLNEDGVTLDFLADHIQPVMALTVNTATGEQETEFSLGVFHLTFPDDDETPARRLRSVQANDVTIYGVLDQLADSYTVAAGSNPVDEAKAILTSAGFTRFNIPPTSGTLATAITWPAGTSKLAVANDLLMAVHYYTCWADENAVICSFPSDVLVARAIDVAYAGDSASLVAPPFRSRYDQTRFANRVVVVVNDPARTPFSVIATNDDPTSPVSTARLGYVVQKTITDANLIDLATAQARARSELSEAASLYRVATLRTFLDPRRRTNEVYQLDLVRDDGGVVADGTWHAHGWRLDCAIGAVMEHTVARIEPARGTV